MKKRFVAVLVVFVVFALAFAGVSRFPDRLLDHLVGRWVLSGTIAGKNTTHDVSAERVLHDGYVRIHEVSREVDSNGAPAYEAIIFISFDPTSGDYSCLWLDSTGNGGLSAQAIGHAKAKANTIPFTFKDREGRVSFENTFSYDKATDTWSWEMNNIQKDKREPFGRIKLIKK
jgi:hypothetical protein